MYNIYNIFVGNEGVRIDEHAQIRNKMKETHTLVFETFSLLYSFIKKNNTILLLLKERFTNSKLPTNLEITN